jgi:hypothetical protein
MQESESTRPQAVRKKKVAEMSREDLLVLVRDILDAKQRAEDLFKQAEEENVNLKSRLAKMVEDQRSKQSEEDAVVYKVVSERDMLKQKTVELVTNLKSEKSKNAELSSALDRVRLQLQLADDRAREISASLVTQQSGK